MAFDETQKAQIRFFLGYPDVYREANPRLESAIVVMGGRPETQNIIEMLLARLTAIYGANPNDPGSINGAVAVAGISKIVDAFGETVEYGNNIASKNGSNSSSILNDLFNYAKTLVGALSSYCAVPINADVFGKGGYPGDKWKFGNGISHISSLMDYL